MELGVVGLDVMGLGVVELGVMGLDLLADEMKELSLMISLVQTRLLLGRRNSDFYRYYYYCYYCYYYIINIDNVVSRYVRL